MAEGPARHPDERVLLVRHGLPDGPRHVSRCRAPRRARARGLGRRVRRARRRTFDHRRDGRKAPCHHRSRVTTSRDRQQRHPARRHRLRGQDGGRGTRGSAPRRRRTHDRLCAGGRGEYRRVRPAPRDRGDLPGRPTSGCTSTEHSACGRPPLRRYGTSPPARSTRTPGRPMRTSGSTSRTTAASRSSLTPRHIERRCA